MPFFYALKKVRIQVKIHKKHLKISKLKEIIHAIDPHAFVAINDVTDSMSKNLRYSRFQKRATVKVTADGVVAEIPVQTEDVLTENATPETTQTEE